MRALMLALALLAGGCDPDPIPAGGEGGAGGQGGEGGAGAALPPRGAPEGHGPEGEGGTGGAGHSEPDSGLPDGAPDAPPTDVCEQHIHPSRAAAFGGEGPGALYELGDGSGRICRACAEPCRTPQPDPLPPGGPVAPDCDPCGLSCPLPACWTLAPPGA